MTQSAAAVSSWMTLGLIGALVVLLAAAVVLAVRLARRLRAARGRAERLADLIEAVPDQGLLLLDSAGCVHHCNAAAERLHGYRAGEILGQHYAFLFTAEDRQGRLPENELEATARDGPTSARGWRMHRDGRRFMVEARLQALRGSSGRLMGFSVVERDISERLAQEQALAGARSLLAGVQKLAALGRLSEGIAHEFNNGVHVIKNCVELLRRHRSTEPQAQELLRMIKRNADRAAGLSQHLLGLARRQPLNPVATDVNEVVGAVVTLLRQTLNENIVVEEQLDEALSWVTVDRSELEAALLHVAANARDAMPGGGRLTFLTAEVLQPATADPDRPGRHNVMISIRDAADEEVAAGAKGAVAADGGAAELGVIHAGADPVGRARAQADESSLDLVRGLLEHSHGQLQVERQGAGSTVNLCLPCRAG